MLNHVTCPDDIKEVIGIGELLAQFAYTEVDFFVFLFGFLDVFFDCINAVYIETEIVDLLTDISFVAACIEDFGVGELCFYFFKKTRKNFLSFPSDGIIRSVFPQTGPLFVVHCVGFVLVLYNGLFVLLICFFFVILVFLPI